MGLNEILWCVVFANMIIATLLNVLGFILCMCARSRAKKALRIADMVLDAGKLCIDRAQEILRERGDLTDLTDREK